MYDLSRGDGLARRHSLCVRRLGAVFWTEGLAGLLEGEHPSRLRRLSPQ